MLKNSLLNQIIQTNSKKLQQRVTFNNTVKINYFVDSDDDKAARAIYWQFVVADRLRFRNKISEIEKLLAGVFIVHVQKENVVL